MIKINTPAAFFVLLNKVKGKTKVGLRYLKTYIFILTTMWRKQPFKLKIRCKLKDLVPRVLRYRYQSILTVFDCTWPFAQNNVLSKFDLCKHNGSVGNLILIRQYFNSIYLIARGFSRKITSDQSLIRANTMVPLIFRHVISTRKQYLPEVSVNLNTMALGSKTSNLIAYLGWFLTIAYLL